MISGKKSMSLRGIPRNFKSIIYKVNQGNLNVLARTLVYAGHSNWLSASTESRCSRVTLKTGYSVKNNIKTNKKQKKKKKNNL